jgi:oxygen-independent coproporphyrinogen-3 oxidase
MQGLYIHIPFCSGKCSYCGFVSFKAGSGDVGIYLKALAQEARIHRDLKPDTLYIGGGTPGELQPKGLNYLFEIIEKNFKPVSSFRESTFEANPESLSKNKIKILKDAGIKRISLGLQSCNDKFLKILGRRHDFTDFFKTFSQLRLAGFKNINVDLMIGVPHQTLSDACIDAKTLISLSPEHISLYGLQIELGTDFYRRKMEPNGDLTEKMYRKICSLLTRKKYNHYEISNFSKPGYECIHNINYWNGGQYIGLGVSAAGYLKKVRKTNTCDFKTYCKFAGDGCGKIACETEKLTGRAKVGEDLIIGLRKISGTKLSLQVKKYFAGEISRLKQQGLLKTRAGQLMLTKKGLYLSNMVFRSFVRPFEG